MNSTVSALAFSLITLTIIPSCEPSLAASRANRGVMSDRELRYRGNDRVDTIQEAQTRSVTRQDQRESYMQPLNVVNDIVGGANNLRNGVSWLTR